VDCYSCGEPAINACRRCTKAYCDAHGNAQYCAECLAPASALPSFNLYRGALMVMLLGTVVAVYLLVRPPGETRGASPVVVGRSSPTATPDGGEGDATVAPQTPRATSTPARTPSPTVTESPFIEYVVQEGDSLFGIAEANLPADATVTEYAQAIATLNGFSVEDPILVIGNVLLLPKPPSE
jgi:hypothetical protein